MIEEQATVVVVDDTNITVTSDVKSACSGCQQVEQCGSGQVAKAFPQKKMTLTLQTNLSVSIGDKVVIGLSEVQLLKSAWQVYSWPILGLIFGSWLGQWLVNLNYFPHELFAILLGGFGGFVGFLLARQQQIATNSCVHLAPKVLRIENQTIKVVEISD
jgi:sigma-E factor negative regulatory protein RseC